MVAGRLRELRLARKISQKNFAGILGVSQQTVASWEGGRTEPAHNALREIANYFEVSTDYLLGHESANPGTWLSCEQKNLLASFDALNADGKKIIINLIDQLTLRRTEKNLEGSNSHE